MWIGYAVLAVLWLFCSKTYADGQAVFRQHPFEAEPPISRAGSEQVAKALVSQTITAEDFHGGQKCERILFQSPEISGEAERLVITLPKSRVFSELSASIWIRSNCANVRLGMRVRFPHQRDPRTNEPLALEIIGDSYTEATRWQQVSCRTTDEAMQSRLLRLRSQLSDGVQPVRIDEREAYADQLIVFLQLPQGTSGLELDDLEFGPIVEPQTVVPEGPGTTAAAPSRLSIMDDRIRKDGESFFPIFTLYHGESLDLIARSGVNMLWVRSYEEIPLLEALAGMNIGGIASPPQPPAEDAILNSAAIRSIPDWTAPIWAWMLGIKIPGGDRAYINSWADQVRDADRTIRRPILADVSADEREFHRHVDFLASSRFAIHTAASSPDHFEELRGRRDYALPGKPMFTFLQTEASGPLLDYFADRRLIPIVEPEQVLHQGYEAIAAGFKGVGFWKQIPFDTAAPGLDERVDAMRIFCLHCRALEPYLATGRIVDDITVQVGQKSLAGAKSNSPLSSRWDRAVTPAGHVETTNGPSAEIRATVFHTERGLLILLVWHEPGSQCVPGPQTASMVRVLINGIGDVAHAWEVSPTNVGQSNLDMDRVAGGTEITLREFDQVAAIVVPKESADQKSLLNMSTQTRKLAAESFVNLAVAKLKRVREVHDELTVVGAPGLPGAEEAFSRATFYTEQAKVELQNDRSNEARLASQKAMQQLRVIQRAHWEAAVAPFAAPTVTLEATNYQTLPEHWRLISAIGKSKDHGGNRLPSGEFEDETALFAAGSQDGSDAWADGSKNNPWTSLRLERGGVDGGTHLSLIVKPESPPGQTAVVVSPKVDVVAGDIVLVTGQVRIPYALQGPGRHFAAFETLNGRDGAILLKEKTEGWKSFRIVRRVPKEGQLRLRFELTGPGIVNLDHVRVHVVHPVETAAAVP
ncbi:hypothetical protein [Planctomicrobium piriforme]|uniref:hypothetical protein n=1 Tax=Planctomicrobium piriforme TaxID=1576369 RepID=UPI000B864DE4|nr:hypothetical protein [Planctomicrobium piriforme]